MKEECWVKEITGNSALLHEIICYLIYKKVTIQPTNLEKKTEKTRYPQHVQLIVINLVTCYQ